MKIGVDYYPEHWDKALWRADADLMQQIGVIAGSSGGICLVPLRAPGGGIRFRLAG